MALARLSSVGLWHGSGTSSGSISIVTPATPTSFPCTDGGWLRALKWRRTICEPAATATGLAPSWVHDWKHIGVALLAATGVDPSEVARRAGHASVAFTYDRYGHLLPEVDKQAGTKLEALRGSAGRVGG